MHHLSGCSGCSCIRLTPQENVFSPCWELFPLGKVSPEADNYKPLNYSITPPSCSIKTSFSESILFKFSSSRLVCRNASHRNKSIHRRENPPPSPLQLACSLYLRTGTRWLKMVHVSRVLGDREGFVGHQYPTFIAPVRKK